MKKYIVIKADINDGDYSTEETEVTDEQIIKLKEILAKMPRQKNYKGEEIRYETREIGNDDKEDSDYQYITYEEKKFLSKFLPSGDYNYSGIHTIESIRIVQEVETLL